MDDTDFCPICEHKLKTVKPIYHHAFFIQKLASFQEKSCTQQPNHSLIFLVDTETKHIDYLKFSADPTFSIFLELDFLSKKTKVSLYHNSQLKSIILSKLLLPDFPNLTTLNQKLSLIKTLL